MSLNIGTLVGYLQLDDANFERKADNADRKINALQLHLKALAKENPKIGVEVETQTAKLDELKAKLTDLKAQAAEGVDVRVEAVQALIELDRVQTKIRDLHGKTVRVDVDVDKSKLSAATSAISGFGSSLSALPALAIAAGSALIPLVAVAGGLAAALAAPLLIAGGGAGLFAFLAGFAVKDTQKQIKTIDQLQTKLAGLTKGTKEYAQVQSQLTAAQKAFSPAQAKFATALDELKKAFSGFLSGKTGDALLGPLTMGLQLLTHLLPLASPLIVAVGGALTTLLTQLDRAAQSRGFQHFVDQVARLVGPNLIGFARIAGNLATGIAPLIVLLDKRLGGNLVDELGRLTGQFSEWANSDRGRAALRGFFDYFHQVAPVVSSAIGAVARAIAHIVEALAPLGPVVLKGIALMADGLSKIPIPVLTALAGAFVAMVGFQKAGGFKALGALNTALGGLKNSGGTKGIVGSVLGGGVQKVFVVNMPGEGFGGAPGSGPGGIFGKVGGKVGPALAAAGPELGVIGGLGALTWYVETHPKPITEANPKAVAAINAYQARPGYQMPMGAQYQIPTEPSHPHLTSTTAAFDALKARAKAASQVIDQIGPHADAAFGAASRDVDAFRAKLALIQDKKFAIIAQDQAAVNSLERLQAMTIRDKSFKVIQNNIERGVGTMGGMQRHALGGLIVGAGSGTSDNVPVLASNGEYVIRAAQYAANRSLVQAINNGSGAVAASQAVSLAGGSQRRASPAQPSTMYLVLDDGTKLRAHIEGVADAVAHADHRYASGVGGMR